jgi:hypothetical protein
LPSAKRVSKSSILKLRVSIINFLKNKRFIFSTWDKMTIDKDCETKAEIKDKGLAKHLGEAIKLKPHTDREGFVKANETLEGNLVFYPDKFAIYSNIISHVPIEKGDIVYLNAGKGSKFKALENIETYMPFIYV